MLYAAAANSGIQMGQLLLTGENAGTKQAYASAYNTTAQRLAAGRAKVQIEANVSAIKQDQILSDTNIQQQQAQAEAAARVSAAAAGVAGGSVDQVIYETEKNAAQRMADNQARAEKDIASQTAQIGGAQLSLETADYQEETFLGTFLQNLKLDAGDVRSFGELFAGGG